jgi:hypothetical protein
VPKISEMKESKFLKQSDVEQPVLWTVHGVERVNVAKEGAEPDYKWAMSFAESDKPLVLNWTNIQLCEKAFGSDDTDHWNGKKIVLYVDPNVSYGGKVVGGIRVRAPKKAAAPAKAAPVIHPPVESELDDDSIPF